MEYAGESGVQFSVGTEKKACNDQAANLAITNFEYMWLIIITYDLAKA